jgi:hypothetical protein
MKNFTLYFVLSSLLSLVACKEKKFTYVFEEKPNLNLSNVKIEEVITFENRLHSIIKEKDTTFNIGTHHYSNIKSLTHKVFKRKDSKLFLESDYYYTKKDSLLKVVLYDWSIYDADGFEKELQEKEVIDDSIITNKFQDLIKCISFELDKNHHFNKSSPFQDMTVWQSKEIIVFLGLISDKKPTQIHLFIGPNNPNFRKEEIIIEADTSSNPQKNGL